MIRLLPTTRCPGSPLPDSAKPPPATRRALPLYPPTCRWRERADRPAITGRAIASAKTGVTNKKNARPSAGPALEVRREQQTSSRPHVAHFEHFSVADPQLPGSLDMLSQRC